MLINIQTELTKVLPTQFNHSYQLVTTT